MISKELLSEVLQHEVKYIGGITNNMLLYCGHDNKIGAGRDYYINIYELAHKCKEWAYTKGYGINSRMYKSQRESERSQYLDDYDFESYEHWICHVCKSNNNNVIHHESKDTEPEAIFKACEWILQQNETNN